MPTVVKCLAKSRIMPPLIHNRSCVLITTLIIQRDDIPRYQDWLISGGKGRIQASWQRGVKGTYGFDFRFPTAVLIDVDSGEAHGSSRDLTWQITDSGLCSYVVVSFRTYGLAWQPQN